MEEEKEGTCICFAKEKFPNGSQDLLRMGVYLSVPCEIRDGIVKVGVLGETRQLKAFINFIQKLGVIFKVVRLWTRSFCRTLR
ncbi:MAG: hypothetical protein ABSD42_07300 [Candidatus Bathyarchaeia archaeon]